MFLFFHTVMTYGSQMRYLKEFYRCREYASSETNPDGPQKTANCLKKKKKKANRINFQLTTKLRWYM